MNCEEHQRRYTSEAHSENRKINVKNSNNNGCNCKKKLLNLQVLGHDIICEQLLKRYSQNLKAPNASKINRKNPKTATIVLAIAQVFPPNSRSTQKQHFFTWPILMFEREEKIISSWSEEKFLEVNLLLFSANFFSRCQFFFLQKFNLLHFVKKNKKL